MHERNFCEPSLQVLRVFTMYSDRSDTHVPLVLHTISLNEGSFLTYFTQMWFRLPSTTIARFPRNMVFWSISKIQKDLTTSPKAPPAPGQIGPHTQTQSSTSNGPNRISHPNPHVPKVIRPVTSPPATTIHRAGHGRQRRTTQLELLFSNGRTSTARGRLPPPHFLHFPRGGDGRGVAPTPWAPPGTHIPVATRR